MLAMERPILAHFRCGEFSSPVEPSHRMKAKRQNMFWKVVGSAVRLLHQPGLSERLWGWQSGVGEGGGKQPGSWWLCFPQRPPK